MLPVGHPDISHDGLRGWNCSEGSGARSALTSDGKSRLMPAMNAVTGRPGTAPQRVDSRASAFRTCVLAFLTAASSCSRVSAFCSAARSARTRTRWRQRRCGVQAHALCDMWDWAAVRSRSWQRDSTVQHGCSTLVQRSFHFAVLPALAQWAAHLSSRLSGPVSRLRSLC